MMFEISTDQDQIRRLQQSLGAKAKRLDRELTIAVRATTKKTHGEIAKDVAKRINITAKGVKETMRMRVVTGANPSGRVTLLKTARPSLKRFGARQIRPGVSYRISKGGKRPRVEGAFMGPKPGVVAGRLGGHAFKRKGKARTPIIKLHGASPWGVFRKRRLRRPTARQTRVELRKQIERRIRFNVLRSGGFLN